MKTIIVTTIAALTLTACGKEIVYVNTEDTAPAEQPAEEPAETTIAPTTTQAPTPETRPTLPPEPEEPAMNGYQPDVYLQYTKDNTPYWYYSYTDENLINLGISLCEWLDEGTTIDRILLETMYMAEDIDPALNDDVGIFIRGVVRYICPEHYGQIEALA
jgi:hypothetical protein